MFNRTSGTCKYGIKYETRMSFSLQIKVNEFWDWLSVCIIESSIYLLEATDGVKSWILYLRTLLNLLIEVYLSQLWTSRDIVNKSILLWITKLVVMTCDITGRRDKMYCQLTVLDNSKLMSLIRVVESISRAYVQFWAEIKGTQLPMWEGSRLGIC